jgi:DNA-binding beta-propeller fold protein YncE
MTTAHGLFMSLLAAIAAVGGCAGPPGPIFPERRPALVWPRAPDQPRIQYIGELFGQASLGVKPSGWRAVSAVVGGPPPEVEFSTPNAVAVDGNRVFVSDAALGVVHVLDLDERKFSLIREAGGAPLLGPMDVVFVNGLLAVADARREAVFLFDRDGNFIRRIGDTLLKRPVALAASAEIGELFVIDGPRHTCLVFGFDGELRRRIGGDGDAPGKFRFPTGAAWSETLGLVVADAMNFRIQTLDNMGNIRSVFGKKGDAAGDFARPRDVAVDSAGNIYVLDNQFENVQLFDREGRLLMAFGSEGGGPGQFALPAGITIDRQDRIWIADTYNRRVQVFQYLSEDAP